MKSGSGVYLATLAVLASTLAASRLSEHRVPEFLETPLSSVSEHLAGWQAAGALPLEGRALALLRPTDVLSRVYEKDGRRLQLFVSYYASQRAGETMHSPKQCLPGSGWQIWKQDTATVDFNGGRVTINKYGVQKAAQRMLVFYWYQSKNRILASEYLGKIFLVRDALLEGRTAGAMVRIALDDDPQASEEGLRFAAALMPQIQRCFPR